MLRVALSLAVVALFLGPPAAADPVDGRVWSVKSVEHGVLGGAELRPRAQPLRPGATQRRVEPAAARPWRRIGLFANGMTFRVLQHGDGLDLRGGAYLRLLRNLRLQGSYRVFDYDRIGGDSTREKDSHGPLFGLRLNF